MRIGHASTIAIMAIVTFLSLAAPPRTIAQTTSSVPGAIVPMDAPDVNAGHLRRAVNSRIAARETPSVHVAFLDEDTPWILPPTPPPDEFETVGVLQCVPYARFMSGIGLRGDAWTWWDKAAGIYARGNHPEPGAVLSFRGIERMPLGHVAVVTQVLSQRRILVDHANWPNAIVQHGAISRDVQVIDVSAANDWTEVRVQFGEGGPLGSVYPANGFIYGWTETGVTIAQPRFSLDYALWSPVAPSWRMFNAINYLWALQPAERKRAYAAAGVVPNPGAAVRGKPALVLGPPAGSGLNVGAFEPPLGVNRLDVGLGARGGFGPVRFMMQ